MRKKSYSHNTRKWEEKNGIYLKGIPIRESELTKEEYEEIKNDMKEKGSSISSFIISYLREYLDNKRKGGK